MRRYLQPSAIIGPVPKPKLSAPSIAALTTSRPVFKPPSVCSRTLLRRSLRRRVWCVSVRPSSHAPPAYLFVVCGLVSVLLLLFVFVLCFVLVFVLLVVLVL